MKMKKFISTLSLVLAISVGTSLAQAYDEFWYDIQSQTYETYDDVSNRIGNGWDDIRYRVETVYDGLQGIHDRAWEEINNQLEELNGYYNSSYSSDGVVR